MTICFRTQVYFHLYKVMTDKSKIINDVCVHPIIGFGSVKSVYKEAKSIDNTITLSYVKEYFSKLPS